MLMKDSRNSIFVLNVDMNPTMNLHQSRDNLIFFNWIASVASLNRKLQTDWFRNFFGWKIKLILDLWDWMWVNTLFEPWVMGSKNAFILKRFRKMKPLSSLNINFKWNTFKSGTLQRKLILSKWINLELMSFNTTTLTRLKIVSCKRKSIS